MYKWLRVNLQIYVEKNSIDNNNSSNCSLKLAEAQKSKNYEKVLQLRKEFLVFWLEFFGF